MKYEKSTTTGKKEPGVSTRYASAFWLLIGNFYSLNMMNFMAPDTATLSFKDAVQKLLSHRLIQIPEPSHER